MESGIENWLAKRIPGSVPGLIGLAVLLAGCQVLAPPKPQPEEPVIQTLPYERTNPPAQYARRSLPPPNRPLDVQARSPQQPAVYPPGVTPPRLKTIPGGSPPVPKWVRETEATTIPARVATPRSYMDPEHAQRMPAEPQSQSSYVPPELPAYAPAAHPSEPLRAPAPAPASSEDWFDRPVTAERPRYEMRDEVQSHKDRALAAAMAEARQSDAPSPAPARQPVAAATPQPAYAPAYREPAPLPAYSAPAPAYSPPASGGMSLPAPVARAAPSGAPQGFILGPGDVVTVNVLGRPELTSTVDVNGDGEIVIPLAGAVAVNGLSTAEAGERIAQALRAGEYVVNPQVTLITTESRSQQISVLGEVKSPSRFKIETRTTVLDGIAQAGGIAETGANFAYILRREGSVIVRYELDLDALLEAGAGQQYFELQAGDTVVVPKADLFYIYGEVRQPNAYRLRPGMAVVQALSMAGGLTEKGSDRRIAVRRRASDGSLRDHSIELSEPVFPDDVIFVKERFF